LISHHLGISIKTVEAHRSRVMEKMAARSLADLIRICGEATTSA
jgi:FixJ family two-component response regulator